MPLSFAFLLYLAAPDALPQPPVIDPSQPSSENEIVVTARQLRNFRAVVKTRRKTGEPYCKLRRSSGNQALDTELCASMVGCHVEIENSAAIRVAREAAGRKREVERVWIAEANRCMAPFFQKHGFGEQ